MPMDVSQILRKRIRSLIPQRLRYTAWQYYLCGQTLFDQLSLTYTTHRSQQQLRDLASQQDLQLHLGCGRDIRVGWINIDLLSPRSVRQTLPAGAVFLPYDLRRGLPIQRPCCKLIYSAHFFEHLDYGDGLRLMNDCYRALQPNGVFRLALPDYTRLFRAYLQQDHRYFAPLKDFTHHLLPELHGAEPMLADYISALIYQRQEHRFIYDVPKLYALLTEIGYRLVYQSDYRDGIDPDTPLRRTYSFYVEAVK